MWRCQHELEQVKQQLEEIMATIVKTSSTFESRVCRSEESFGGLVKESYGLRMAKLEELAAQLMSKQQVIMLIYIYIYDNFNINCRLILKGKSF